MQINRTGNINNVKKSKFLPCMGIRIWPKLGLYVQCTVIKSRARLDIVVSVTSLVVNVYVFGIRGPGSFPGWALITIFFLAFFALLFAKLLQTSNMELYKRQKLHSLFFYIELSSKFVGVGLKGDVH